LGHAFCPGKKNPWPPARRAYASERNPGPVYYYGFYSNVARGKRKKTDAYDKIPCFLETELTGKTFRRNWARLIQKIYEVDPLVCPKCFGAMRIIAFIEEPDVMKKILKYLGLKQLFQYQLPYPFFEHDIAESVNAVFVNVVIVDQVFKRLFHLRRPFEPDPLQVVNLVYIFPPENTKQRAGFFLVVC
jgi:hypothetical protein